MNIFNKLILFTLLITLTVGCADGEDGKVFLRIRALLEAEPVSNVSIDNPDIPEDFTYHVYYETQPGNYEFEYVDHNGDHHPQGGEFAKLDIVAEPGSSASIFKQGEDGQDVYIDLWLLSTGAVIEVFDYLTVPDELVLDE